MGHDFSSLKKPADPVNVACGFLMQCSKNGFFLHMAYVLPCEDIRLQRGEESGSGPHFFVALSRMLPT
jgi:hypothetical protein